MRKEQKHIDLRLIEPNTGQLDWLPRNPRQWTQGDIDRTAKSIQEDPDFLEDRPLLVVHDEVRGGKLRFVVFAGNLRREGALAVKKLQTVPCVVYYCENPPFSILSAIVRFFCQNGIQFFIFAPSLTLFSAHDCDVTYIVANAPVTYENGAVVSTGFITNLIPDLRIWCNPDLREQIIAAQPSEDKTKQGFVYPDNIVTSAVLGRLVAHATELKIRKVSCEHIKSSDSAEEQGRSLYGGGYIMSDRAAAERAAAERAAAERAAATRLNISARERAIIERLNEQDKE